MTRPPPLNVYLALIALSITQKSNARPQMKRRQLGVANRSLNLSYFLFQTANPTLTDCLDVTDMTSG